MKRHSTQSVWQSRFLKQIAAPALEFVGWLLAGSIAGVFGLNGWFSIFVLLIGFSYAVKLSEGKKRMVKREFVPVFVTAGLSFLFNDPVNKVCAILAVVMLLARLYELYIE